MKQYFSENEYFSKNFTEIDQNGEIIESLEFEDCTFSDCDFSDATFKHCRFIDCKFQRCNLSVLKVLGTRFLEVEFESCKLIGVDWTIAEWPRLALSSPLSFHQCLLNDSSFFALHLTELTMTECKSHDVDFREGNFFQSNFEGTDFCHSLFSRNNLKEVNFINAINFNIDIFQNDISKAKFNRFDALSLLSSLEIELVD